MIARAIEKVTAPMRRRIATMISRCTVKLVNDALKMQRVQITLLGDEALDGVERLQDYGFTSNPLPDAEAIALAAGGLRSNMVVIACADRRHRLTNLEPGEVAIYTDEGDKIVIKRGGTVEITAATKLSVLAPIDTSEVYKVDGTQVVGPQGAAVADPAGGVTIDAQARAQLALLLARCRAHGLVAP